VYSKIIVVGSGLFGLTIAERIAEVLGKEVLVVEKRSHIGGNAWSEFDEKTGIEIHKYGSHLFHTSHEGVWSYVNNFTKFNQYQHHVWTQHAGETYSMPINLGTISHFFKRSLTPSQSKELIQGEIRDYEPEGDPSFESVAINAIGHSLYNAFIKGYTEKQWQVSPNQLSSEIFTRLPLRFNYNSRYFNDTYEGLPLDGYQKFLKNLADHKLIKIETDADYFKKYNSYDPKTLIIYTGPIDQYFEFKYGLLGWRTLDFEIDHLDVDDFQGTSVMNYADLEIPFTRIHEFQHLHPERLKKQNTTVIMREFSRISSREDEPYYPINTLQDRAALRDYRKETQKLSNVIFGGRLGTYQYLDMHMAIASALTTFETNIRPRFN
jgi:UDP-galactopyranose mutase